MTLPDTKDIAASVRQRLLNKAKAENRQFEEILRYYMIERFLYRLSKSPYSEKFILKGALMLTVWESPPTRPTSDIDMLVRAENDLEQLTSTFREISGQNVEPDGLLFDTSDVRSEIIIQFAAYPGVRIRIVGRLGQARSVFHVDVGFGDVVIPPPKRITYPVILEMPAPVLFGYSQESSIAEKVESMVRFGPVNSRMKDFYDIWLLSNTNEFKGQILSKAIRGTFDARGTRVPDDISGLLMSIAGEEGKQAQWTAFLERSAITNVHSMFSEVVDHLCKFLTSPFGALSSEELFEGRWNPGGPWTVSRVSS